MGLLNRIENIKIKAWKNIEDAVREKNIEKNSRYNAIAQEADNVIKEIDVLVQKVKELELKVEENKSPTIHTKEKIMYCTAEKGTIRAKGYSPDGKRLVVLKDSQAVLTEQKHASNPANHIFQKRRELINKGILKQNGEFFIFTDNYEFRSWSGAACVVCGGSVSGPREWEFS